MTDESAPSDNIYESENIDDLLTQQDAPKETAPEQDDTPIDNEPEQKEPESAEQKVESDTDEYGNEKSEPPSKTYTEDEVNERINAAVRERLSRLEKNSQPQAEQKNPESFEYDKESSETWEQQLESFVKQTVSKMHAEQAARIAEAQQQQANAEFEQKFLKGMDRFKDYREVVKADTMTDAMVMATRAMDDPAAFVYAAVKRAPEEIKRISALKDPYAQMVEIGRLEERMRKAKTGTSAPRPLAKTKDDASMVHKDEKEESVEDLIAQSERRRQYQLRQARKR